VTHERPMKSLTDKTDAARGRARGGLWKNSTRQIQTDRQTGRERDRGEGPHTHSVTVTHTHTHGESAYTSICRQVCVCWQAGYMT